ncbi:MAG: TolC family protein [Acidobacteria bacterium]|nr:TolC family protein [Acidobacteriota bacterium]
MRRILAAEARSARGLLVLLLMTLAPAVASTAQERKGPEAGPPLGGAMGRFFYGNFRAPSTKSLELRGDAAFAALIRDGKIQLTPEDAVRLALEGNIDINVERYGPYLSMWGIERAGGILDSTLSFNTRLDRTATPASSALQGGTSVLDLQNLYGIVWHKPFAFGLDFDIRYRTTRARSNNTFLSLNPYFQAGLGVTFTQHLLRDFGRISRTRGIRIARNDYGVSEAVFIARTTDIIANVLSTYWDLVYAEEDIALKEASRRLAELTLEQNRIQVEVGTMAPLDVVQAEAEVAVRNEQLVVSRFNRKMAEDQLKKLLSPNVDVGAIAVPIEPVTRPFTPPLPVSKVEEAVQRALEIRPEIKQAQLEQESRRVQVDYTRNQLRPTLDFVAGYNQAGLGGNRIIRDYSQGFINAPIVGITPGGFWDSLDSLFSQKYLGYSLGFSFRMPIGNRDARASNAQAQIECRQAEERLRSLRQRIALEVRQAYERRETDLARVQAAEATVRYSERKLEGEQEKYALGATTTRFVLEAQRDLLDARTRLLKAKIDLIKSQVAIDKAVGDTFSANHIELKDALPPLR